MPGTIKGGKRAAETNKKKYGKDWYAKIGAKGGHNGHTGGFAANPTLARLAGSVGGRRSKRGKSVACEQRRKQAIKMLEEGLTAKQIAIRLGVSYMTVLRYLKEEK